MPSPLPGPVGPALSTLLSELVDGPPGEEAFVLNPGDPGLLRSLERLSADDASVPGANGSSIASHVDHLCYGLGLLNRWQAGEEPFGTADYGPSWTRVRVTDAEWIGLRARLANELASWRRALEAPRDLSPIAANGIVASVVHLAYHLGAMRQLAPRTRGPRNEESRASAVGAG